jgi:hypothetical protein
LEITTWYTTAASNQLNNSKKLHPSHLQMASENTLPKTITYLQDMHYTAKFGLQYLLEVLFPHE